MNKDWTRLYADVDEWAQAHRDEFVADISRVCRIRSVSVMNKQDPEQPFGEACRKMLDEALEKAVRDSAAQGHLPAVAHRSNRRSWKITMYLDDWLTLCRVWGAMEQTLPPDPESPEAAAYPGSNPETCRPPAESPCP